MATSAKPKATAIINENITLLGIKLLTIIRTTKEQTTHNKNLYMVSINK